MSLVQYMIVVGVHESPASTSASTSSCINFLSTSEAFNATGLTVARHDGAKHAIPALISVLFASETRISCAVDLYPYFPGISQ